MDFYFINKINSRAGAIKKGKLSQLCILDKQEIGRIYRGKVQFFAKNLDACFVDIGLKFNGLLKIKDCIGSVAVGDNVIVEVKRSAQGTKGPLLSMKYSLSGRNLVYLPFESGVFPGGPRSRRGHLPRRHGPIPGARAARRRHRPAHGAHHGAHRRVRGGPAHPHALLRRRRRHHPSVDRKSVV